MDENDTTPYPASDSDDSLTTSTATSSPSSHCYHCPFYFAMSIALAYISITTSKHTAPNNPLASAHALAFNASRALRLHGGFHITATLLQISPDLFFSTNISTTVFAIQDSAFSDLSIPPWEMRQLLRHHATPSALPIAELLDKPPGSCFESLADNKKLVITNTDPGTGSVTINNVLISDPDIFLEGPISIHGVLGPFDEIPSPGCGFSDRSGLLLAPSGDDHQEIEWTRIIRALTSNGFVSFAIGLNAVLDKMVEDYGDLGSVTVFAPPNSGFISSSSPFLDRIVRLHILPQRFTYMELVLTESSSLKTLIPSYDVKMDKSSQTLVIDGVEITGPDLVSSDNFVIHGISRDFDAVELFSSFR